MSLQDYAKRKYDYLAFRNVKKLGEAKLGLELFNKNDNGQICTGIQKLSQRWALEFLTEEGSMPGKPNRGADFMTIVRQGRLQSTPEIYGYFATASLTIKRNLRDEEYADMPADEKFSDATLLSVSFLPGYLSLSVLITSMAGDEREIILPIATLP